MRWFRGVLAAGVLSALAGCTTLATGVLVSPPGVHKYSFRECLIGNGFFTPTALVGTSLENYEGRHAKDTRHYPIMTALSGMNDGEFIALSAKNIYGGLMPHQQFGGGADAAAVADGVGARPYALNIAGEPYGKIAGKPVTGAPGVGDDGTLPEFALNRYLDCYIAPVGDEPDSQSPGLLKSNRGDIDGEGRLLRAHILLAVLAAYGTELVTSHASAKQPAYAAMLLKDIANAELELRIASRLINNAALQKAGLSEALDADGSLPYQADSFGSVQRSLRWQDYTMRILRVFQVAKDTQVIDAGQSLDRLTNILAAVAKPGAALFQGLLKDSLQGFGAMQKIALFGDAMLRDGRETLAAGRLATTYGKGGFTLSKPGAAIQRWHLWDGNIRQSCNVLAAIAKDSNTACVPSETALGEELDRRIGLTTGKTN